MKLQFIKSNTEPSTATSGAIWFDTTNHTIKVKTDSGWDVYGINIETLTQTEFDNLETKDNNKIYFIKEE